MRGLLVGHRRPSWLPDRGNHRAAGRRGRTLTQAQLARRERRERLGEAGLTGKARELGIPYLPGRAGPSTRFPMAPPVPPVAEQRRGRRRPDGHRRADENAANGWT